MTPFRSHEIYYPDYDNLLLSDHGTFCPNNVDTR
jgi:hypothetical protein